MPIHMLGIDVELSLTNQVNLFLDAVEKNAVFIKK